MTRSLCVSALVSTALLIIGASAACGSSSGTSGTTDAGSSGSSGGPEYVCNGTTACPTEGACCTATVPDGFGAEGYRCASGAWKQDRTCDPPPPVCPSPLTGTLVRANGSSIAVTCFGNGGAVGVVAARFTLASGETLELYFDRVPAAGAELTVIPYAERNMFPDARDAGAPDGGAAPTATKAAFRIGRVGGFAGFSEVARSTSGKITVTAVTATGITLDSLRATLDAETMGSAADWGGKLTGSF